MLYFDSKSVGKRISKARKDRKITQCQLAEQLKYASERQLQRIESGMSACSVDKLIEIAQVLKVSTDYLLLGETGVEMTKGYEGKLYDLLKGTTNQQKEYIYLLTKSAVEHMELLAQ